MGKMGLCGNEEKPISEDAELNEYLEMLRTRPEMKMMFQLAKGAIRAGIEVLLAVAGVHAEEVTQIYLAGGFGVRMDEQAAIHIGLLPESFRGRIHPVGNSSLSGAVFAGRCAQLESACEELLTQCSQVVLAEQPEFEENYLRYMNM